MRQHVPEPGAVASTSDPPIDLSRVARAATVANTVAATFLAQHTREQRQKAQRTKASVQSQLDSVGNGTAATGLASALRAQVANLAVTQAAAGTDLTLAERATAPATPVAPRPLRNALFAGLSALLLAVVAAGGGAPPRPPRAPGRGPAAPG